MNIPQLQETLSLQRTNADRRVFFMLTLLNNNLNRRADDVSSIVETKLRLGQATKQSRREELLVSCRTFVDSNGYRIPDYLLEAIVTWVIEDSERIQEEKIREQQLEGDGE